MKSVSGLRARNRIYLGEGVGEEQEEQNMSTKRNKHMDRNKEYYMAHYISKGIRTK